MHSQDTNPGPKKKESYAWSIQPTQLSGYPDFFIPFHLTLSGFSGWKFFVYSLKWFPCTRMWDKTSKLYETVTELTALKNHAHLGELLFSLSKRERKRETTKKALLPFAFIFFPLLWRSLNTLKLQWRGYVADMMSGMMLVCGPFFCIFPFWFCLLVSTRFC